MRTVLAQVMIASQTIDSGKVSSTKTGFKRNKSAYHKMEVMIFRLGIHLQRVSNAKSYRAFNIWARLQRSP